MKCAITPVLLGCLLLPGVVLGQNQNRQSTPSSPLYWGVDLIVNNYSRQVGAYYKLSPEQEEYTRSLLQQRVKRFLVDYEKDVRGIAAEIWDYKSKGQLPPPEIAQEWGMRAQQLMPAIRAEIMEGNAKWREILNDDQKAQHDRDMAGLEKYFDAWDKTFDRWSKGNIGPTDLDQPGALSRQPRTIRPSEDAWEMYVRSIIARYNMDEGQQQAANSVLRESREQASHYRESHKSEFSQIDAADQAAAQSGAKNDPDELKKAQDEARKRLDQRRELEKPISEIFERLKSRLNDLPTGEQRRVYESRMAKLETIGKRATSRPGIVVISTQPASTEPATAAAAN